MKFQEHSAKSHKGKYSHIASLNQRGAGRRPSAKLKIANIAKS